MFVESYYINKVKYYITHSLLQTAEVLVSVLDEVVAAFGEGINNNDTGAM